MKRILPIIKKCIHCSDPDALIFSIVVAISVLSIIIGSAVPNNSERSTDNAAICEADVANAAATDLLVTDTGAVDAVVSDIAVTDVTKESATVDAAEDKSESTAAASTYMSEAACALTEKMSEICAATFEAINDEAIAEGAVTDSYVGQLCGNSAERGTELVDYAVRFVGNPYRWGGTSLTDGADCSGFTMTLYGMYGVEMPHSSISQASCGTEVDGLDNAQPGDLIVYNGHVAIYIGDGQIVHAANSRLGICISGIDFMEMVGIRRLL